MSTEIDAIDCAHSEDKATQLAKLFAAAKDENELLEFKNYELLFKIQELEQSLDANAQLRNHPTATPQPPLPESITKFLPASSDRFTSSQKQNGTPTIGFHGEQVSDWLSDSPTTGYWSDSELPSSIKGANGEQHHTPAEKCRLWSTYRRQKRATPARTGRHSAADESLFSKLAADGSRKLPNSWHQKTCTLHDLDGFLITGAHNGQLPISNNNNNEDKEEEGAVKVASRKPFGSISCLAELNFPRACDIPAADSNQQSSQQLPVTRSDSVSRNMPDGSSNTLSGNRSLLMKKPAAGANWRNSATPVLRKAYAKLQQPKQRTISRSKSDLENQMNQATPEAKTPGESLDSATLTTGLQSNFGFRHQLSARHRAKSISNLSSASISTASSATSSASIAQPGYTSAMSYQFVTKIPSLIGQSHGDPARMTLGKGACSRSYSSLISTQEQKTQLACQRSINKRPADQEGSEESKKCTQCSSLEAKVGALTAEKQQLGEQITELEELENDSRLMSQKLAQQLAGVGHQLAECKLELEKTCETKSKLQFQNKRLSFELKQRLESIEQLQCQLRRLQTKAALRHQLTLEQEPLKPEVGSGPASAKLTKEFIGSSWPSNSQHSDEDDSSSSSSTSSSSPKDSGAGSVKSESCLDSVYAQSAAGDSHWDDGKRSSSPRSTKTDEHPCTVSSISSSSFSSSSADESDHRTEQNAAAEQLLLASSRQQVLHKKISTAKILRGSQVHSNRSSLLVNTDSMDTSSSKMEQARLVQVVSGGEEEGEGLEKSLEVAVASSASTDEQPAFGKRSSSTLQSIDSQLDAQPIEQSGGSEKQPEVAETGNSMDAIKLLEREIASLRTRLMQANTLNDNLVSELGGLNKKQHQPGRQARAQSSLSGGCTCAEAAAAREPSSGAKRSIVYLNSGCPLKQVASANEQSGSRFFQPVLDWQNENQQQQLKPDQTARELLEFLRFLLDKMHFHHGRNLELVNENQKLALNALVASNNQRLNVISHSVAMGAGQLHPLRPPPRRRNRMQASVEQAPQPAPPSVVNNSSPKSDAAPTPSGRSATTSALQVAKQTLLSIVPIYHNNNNHNARSQPASKNNKQKQEPILGDNNNNNLDDASMENNHSTSSSIKRSLQTLAKSAQQSTPPLNGWIVLNQSAAPTSNSYNQLGALPGHLNTSHHNHLQVNRQHNNVSVLQINRSTTGASDASFMESNNGRLSQPLTGNQQPYCHPLANETSNLDGQQFIKVHSLSGGAHNDDFDRYKARFDVQLMDLLRRQQWCENIISEKLRVVEQRQHSFRFNSDNNNSHQHHLYLDAKLTSSATSSVNLANYENTSLISSASSQQQVVTHSQSWSIRDQVASSFC